VLRQSGFNGLVTYGADQPIPRLAQEMGFQGMILGVWDPTSTEEMNLAKEAAQYNVVIGYVVGNEGLDVRYDYDTLRSAINELKQATGKPVSTTEQVEDYADTGLIELGDWVFPNVHPYWHGVTDSQLAVDWTVERFQELTERTDKPVVFKEVGLPSRGDSRVNETNQMAYYRLLRETSVVFIWWEAFDQPWKQWAPVEPYWGLFHSNRSPKEVTQYVCNRNP
jgi:exo-beta-1,3-glucanase (GH17 family)